MYLPTYSYVGVGNIEKKIRRNFIMSVKLIVNVFGSGR